MCISCFLGQSRELLQGQEMHKDGISQPVFTGQLCSLAGSGYCQYLQVDAVNTPCPAPSHAESIPINFGMLFYILWG